MQRVKENVFFWQSKILQVSKYKATHQPDKYKMSSNVLNDESYTTLARVPYDKQRYDDYLFIKNSCFSFRKLCFGCNEARNGYATVSLRPIDKDLKVWEMACSGCMTILDSIQQFSIPFAQVASSEGVIEWAVSKRYYRKHESLFLHQIDSHININQNPVYYNDNGESLLNMHHSHCDKKDIIKDYSDRIMHFEFTDSGGEAESLIMILLQAGIYENLHPHGSTS